MMDGEESTTVWRWTDLGPLWAKLTAGSVSHALLLVTLLFVTGAQAEFTPPLILKVVSSGTGKIYYIDRGQDANIKIGDRLNVYRVLRVHTGKGAKQSHRMLLGTMLITDSQAGICSGRFFAEAGIASNPTIRVKTPMKADVVIPNLKIDSSVLFQPGQSTLQGETVKTELDKVVQFMRVFNASKLVIEGHTDADGDAQQNQALSELRAGMVRDFLIDNYEDITAEMVEAKGYGETQPLVNNDTPENKSLNRRIEIVVWE